MKIWSRKMKRPLSAAAAVLAIALIAACSDPPVQDDRESKSGQAEQNEQLDATRQPAEEYRVGQVRMNPHPASLEGKTVVLRWNGKYNGDKFLDRVAELLIEKVPGVRVVKMWEVDPSMATTSYNPHNTVLFSEKIAARKPDLVIASSADGDRCSAWLTIDQLCVEKKGIPTVIITTNVFEPVVETTLEAQGIPAMAVVAVEHPIAGRNADDTRRLVENAFPDILKAATKWQP